MIKNKKRGVVILLVMLCMVLACFVGCGTIDAPSGGVGDNPQGGDRLPSVSASSVIISNDGNSFWVSWDAVEGANSYVVKSGSASLTTEVPLVDLATASGFTVPTGGEKITVTIIAKGDGYKDSSPTSITYEEGKQVRSPEIVSFENGIITWKEDSNAKKYIVKIDGDTAAETTSNTHSVSSLNSNARIDITAVSGSSSATLSVMYNAGSKKLSVMPISEYILSGDIIKWNAVGGAIGYKVVDLDFNSYDVDTTHYIMSIRNIVYGVYPVMPASAVVGSAEVASVDINYLQGSGTASDPYIIKTPFDLRTIDYYELKSYEAGAKSKNYYKIAGDMDYNTVSALESDSNIFTLRKPFFGILDGDGKTLSGISVHYNSGYWALFDYIATGATVKNIKFDNPEINNGVRDQWFIDPAIAMVAYRNYGEVSEITLSNAKFNVTSGSAAGLVIHNYGKVSGCTVNRCELKGIPDAVIGNAAYEMAGVVLENLKGGEVSGNTVNNLTICGTGNNSNIGSSAGVVAINRAGGTVKDNSFNTVTIKNLRSGKEAGGVVGYCATGGTVTKGSGTLGTLVVGTKTVDNENGSGGQGKLFGKKG